MSQQNHPNKLDFYSFFTKYSLLDNYGFLSGFFKRLFRKLIPTVPETGTLAFELLKKSRAGADTSALADWMLEYLSHDNQRQNALGALDRAIATLSAKLVSFGFDYQMRQYFNKLSVDTDGFGELLEAMTALERKESVSLTDFQRALDNVTFAINSLRQNKRLIGTSLHLTIVTKRLLDYAVQTKKLLALKAKPDDAQLWSKLIEEGLIYNRSENTLRKYIKSHTDLLAVEIVGHNSEKGEAYVAEDKAAYWKFFRKGLLGGLLIAIFTIFKILIDKNFSGDGLLAFLYGTNYAACFVLVKLVGGTIATKQPAMTASTIIRYIDKKNEYQLGSVKDVILLLRRVSRSQFISLMGNFLMALSIALLVGAILVQFPDCNPVSAKKADYLVKHVKPIEKMALFYAAIAGIFLALSGFISGYVDNKILVANLPHRIIHHRWLSRWISAEKRNNIARFMEKKFGSIAGNVSLGYLLGGAFLLSYILPFKVDIRHIAFSSANVGYGFVNSSLAWNTIAFTLMSVLLVGLVNFLVSFSITFYIALKSRSVTAGKLFRIIRLSLLDIVKHPLDYVIVRNKEAAT